MQIVYFDFVIAESQNHGRILWHLKYRYILASSGAPRVFVFQSYGNPLLICYAYHLSYRVQIAGNMLMMEDSLPLNYRKFDIILQVCTC